MGETDKHSGGCQCGVLRYETIGDPMMVFKCHCTDCQKSTGAGHLTGAAFADDKIAITGASKGYSYKADSGSTVTNQFCAVCGATTHSQSSSYPGMTMIRLGTLDADLAAKPNLKVFQKHKRSWDADWPEVPGFDDMAPNPD